MYLVNKKNVVEYRNEKYKKDMAFLKADFLDEDLTKGEAVSYFLNKFCLDYVFEDTNVSYFNNPKIMKMIDRTYPEDYKGLTGVAWWEENGYEKNLARVRLYRKTHKMMKRFARELLEFIKSRKEQTVTNVSEKKLNTIREYYYNKINYEVDEENKIVRAYFGKNVKESRDKFARLAIYIMQASFLKPNKDIYDEEVEFIPEHFFGRNFVAVAKYNHEAEQEPFSVEKGKAIAREKLIKQYLRFEHVVGRFNFHKYYSDMELVEKRLENFLKD